ncbi:insulinase family protein [bacterium]|nr:insulinase family protein [bacterium]
MNTASSMNAAAGAAHHSTYTDSVHEYRLDNGLLVLLKVNRTAPVINFNVAYRVGSKFERPGITGLSHLLEHMMFKTTHKFALGEFDRRLKRVGSDNNAYTWLDQTVYYETIAADQIDVALELESDRMRGIACTPDDLASEITVVRNELDQRDDSPFTLLYEELNSMAFVAHPYRIPTIGYKDDVEAVSPDVLLEYYNRFYHPDNAFIVAVGDFEPEQLLGRIRHWFGAIPASGYQRPRLTSEPQQLGERRFVIRRAGQLDYVLCAWHIPPASHPDAYALVVLGNILGSGRTSRLYKVLVDSNMCGEAAAWASNFGYQDPYLFFASAMLNQGQSPEAAEQLIYLEIERLKNEGPSQDELKRARKQARVSFVYDHDSLQAEASALVDFELMSSWRELDKYLPGIEAVSAEDVMRVAAEYLSSDNRTVGIYNALPPGEGGQSGDDDEDIDLDEAEELSRFDTDDEAGELGPPQPPHYRDGAAPRLPLRPAPGHSAAGSPAAGATAASASFESGDYASLFKLDNGITLAVRPNHSNPTVCLHGLLRCGRIDDPPGRPGLGSFVEEMLQSGSQHYDKFALAGMLEDNGISLNYSLGRESLTFGGKSLAEDFTLLLDVLAEQLLRSTFPEDEVEKSRQQIVTDLLDSLDDTSDQAFTAAREAIYGPGSPFSGRVEGDIDSAKAITRAELRDWYSSNIEPGGAIISIVGDIEPRQALELASQRLGAWQARDRDRSALISAGADYRLQPGFRQNIAMKDKSNLSIAMLAPGMSKLEPGWTAAFICSFIFGGDFYSRLNERLRIKDGLTYGSYSRVTAGRASGPVWVSAQVSPQKMEAAIAATMEEMARYAGEGVKEEELELAKNYLTGNFPVRLSTNGAVAAVLTDSLYLERGVDYILRYPDLIRSVSLEEVNAAAARLFKPDNFVTVAAGTLLL